MLRDVSKAPVADKFEAHVRGKITTTCSAQPRRKRNHTTGKSSRMDAHVYGHRLRCSSDLRSRVRDVLEAQVVERVRGKFDQVVFELCYKENSVLSIKLAGRRLTGRDTRAR